MDAIKPVTRLEETEALLRSLEGKSPLFLCAVSNTKVANIPGITVAGANPELVKFTPPADVELLHYGECKCIPFPPATPDGKPTPAIITYTALRRAEIPLLVVDAGCEVKPQTPFVDVGVRGPAGDIRLGPAMPREEAERAFGRALALGASLSRLADYLVVGESIPGGTTTALAVLLALGVDARNKVSSSMPDNPHRVKNSVVEAAMRNQGLAAGSLQGKPLEAVSRLGDPMMACVAGLAVGAARRVPVVLAGGTQMAAVAALIREVGAPALERILIATTVYVVEDGSADMRGLAEVAGPAKLVSVDPGLDGSGKPGLRAFSEGFVKEGVGAGGACLAAFLKSRGSLSRRELLREVEKNYEAIVEARLQAKP